MNSEEKEHKLLRGLAENDTKAIEAIYASNFSLIQALVLNNNGSYDDARDIFQEAMVILYEKAKSSEFQLTCQLKTFLYAISKRLWLKKLKHHGLFVSNTDLSLIEQVIPVEEDLEIAGQKDEEFKLMEMAFQKIGEPCKSLLEAFYIKKKNMAELVELFGYTNTDNAKNQKYKCLMRLKKLFFAQYNSKKSDYE